MDEYSARQADRDREYREAWDSPEAKAWIAGLDPDERARLEAEGILSPSLPGRANGVMLDGDLADSSVASEEPDLAAEIDGEKDEAARAEARADVLAAFCARIRCCDNPLLMFDAACFATGVASLDGCSQSELARRHGVTRAAFSKLATQWVKTFNLPPSRGMKSKKARQKYSRLTRQKWHERKYRQSRRKDQ